MSIKNSTFHFIGIGGIGMCGLAELLHHLGAKVTGSDISTNKYTERLESLGIKVYPYHDSNNLQTANVVVFSSAIQPNNPELLAAKIKKIPIIPRAEALAEIMRFKRGIAIAGTHGKTTTTSLVASILLHAQYDPTIIIGGRLETIQSTAQLGNGQWGVFEADESDGSFMKTSPEITVITNIDNDHLDYYKTKENLLNTFLAFSEKIPFFGTAIVYGDDPEIKKLFHPFSKKLIYFGFESDNNLYAQPTKPNQYTVFLDGSELGSFSPHFPGKYFVLNSLAAIGACISAGLPFEICRDGLSKFQGVDRRFQLKGHTQSGITVYDDYAHHPTEVKAVLSAFKEKFPKQRIVALFQPHRYSRTQICWDDFLSAFCDADKLIVTDIYAASESPIESISSFRLADEIKHPHCSYLSFLDAQTEIKKILQPGDVFVTLGAGDSWKIGQTLIDLDTK